ncbi:hypothetical protein SAMN05444392_11188 [Seinonella peptonophila]|uniref:Uncharacterized protein n=1 Tax=Seinonella peptonophila TaxID=112248 RepID=A0A1M5A1D5_9BACL|nr:hypothetical protein [Seinonella peptonophila]SHF23937.1 hypothetical protein SAMN05444392_11188 [Seinonella peptonophila]
MKQTEDDEEGQLPAGENERKHKDTYRNEEIERRTNEIRLKNMIIRLSKKYGVPVTGDLGELLESLHQKKIITHKQLVAFYEDKIE